MSADPDAVPVIGPNDPVPDGCGPGEYRIDYGLGDAQRYGMPAPCPSCAGMRNERTGTAKGIAQLRAFMIAEFGRDSGGQPITPEHAADRAIGFASVGNFEAARAVADLIGAVTQWQAGHEPAQAVFDALHRLTATPRQAGTA